MARGSGYTGSVPVAVRSLFALAPGTGPRHGVAIRAALSMGVPYTALLLVGRPDLGLQAGAGAFVALYGLSLLAKERAKVLPFVGLAMFACSGLGVLLTPWTVAFSIGLVGVAVGVSAAAFAFRLGPPGPVFFVLLYGLGGNVTAVIDGHREHSPAAFLTAFGAGILFSYLLAVVPLVLPAARRAEARPLRELLPGPWMGRGEWELVLRVAVVAVVGTLVTVVFLDPHRAYWTVAAGVACVGLSATRSYSLGRGLHRTVGTVLGAALYFLIAPLGENPWLLVVILPVLQFVIEQVVVRNYALALIFITPLVLFITGTAVPGVDLEVTAWVRVVDTLIGSAIAILTTPLHRRR